MTSILILGANGMLGHKLVQVLSKRFKVTATIRKDRSTHINYSALGKFNLINKVSAENFYSVKRVILNIRPKVVINCIGIVKQLETAKYPPQTIRVNTLFPHLLAQLCQKMNIRLIHFSTDCVFSGRKGNYLESDVADAEDLYGRTKYLGEVNYDGCLTIRTSIIGHELETSHGLVEWFLSQEGKTIYGYTGAIFSGFTTNALSGIIAHIIANYPDLQGVWHIASKPLSKFELLSLVKKIYKLNIQIKRDETVMYDRSLNADRYRQATGFVSPPWSEMIEYMYQDSTLYAEFRRGNANR